jgi:hypothetical protein
MRSDRKNAQKPMKHKSTHDNPPNLVFVGANAKVSEKTANAMAGNGRRDNEMVSNRVTHFVN